MNEWGWDEPCEKSLKQGNPLSDTIKDTKYTQQYYAYADKRVSVQGSRPIYGNLAKTKGLSSSSLVSTLRGISGTA